MSAAALLARAETLGVSVEAAGDRLRLVATAPPDPALLHDLAGAKPDILDLLTERAAIKTEPKLPAAGTPERDRLDRLHEAMISGLMAAARWRRSDQTPGKDGANGRDH